MEILNLLAEYRTPFFDTLFQLITYLGQETLAVAVICWLYWCQNKKLAYTIVFTYFVSGLAVQGLKITFRIPRPWILDPGFQAVPSAVPAATGYSFPSGHTQSGTALFGSLALASEKNWKKFLCVLSFLLIGFSRMYLGCHTLKDVLTAMVISLASAFFFHWFLYRRTRKLSRPRLTAFLFALCSLSLLLYAYFLYRQDILALDYASDCAKAAGAGAGFALGYYLEKCYIRFSLPLQKSKKITRFLLGLLITFILQQGLKPLLGASLFSGFFRYFIVVTWILAIYPWLFSRCLDNKKGGTH